MNERQQYEKHLAEKLQQLPPPDDEHRRWEQMRSLLDKEMPRGAALAETENPETVAGGSPVL